jgi:hypothetical protein
MVIRCANCNRILSEDEHTCPSCGWRHSGSEIKQLKVRLYGCYLPFPMRGELNGY